MRQADDSNEKVSDLKILLSLSRCQKNHERISVNYDFQTMALLRHRAQAITSFVGRVPFQFMSDVYTRLVQMEVSMR